MIRLVRTAKTEDGCPLESGTGSDCIKKTKAKQNKPQQRRVREVMGDGTAYSQATQETREEAGLLLHSLFSIQRLENNLPRINSL